jgi:two-component system OmpR family response regulator
MTDTSAMTAKASILVVDDDASIREALCEYLARHGFDVRGASDGEDMDRQQAQQPADLVILDWMMPGEDGLSICRRLSASGQPILMLSAQGSSPDRVIGLEMGADDYLAKPFEPRELLARVRALLRRPEKQARAGELKAFVFGGWSFQAAERLLWNPQGERVPLSALEYSLLQAFVERSGRLLSRDVLMQLTRGYDVDSFDRAIDLSISRLRRKLDGQSTASMIETVRGEGYRFCLPVQRQ